jgi:hypothetical protein
MNILIMKDKDGGTAYLTTESPASHYGIPVLQITAEDVDGDFGPGELIGDLEAGPLMYAADIVASWAKQPGRTEAELKAARMFLRQWPEGPQI